MKAYPVRVHLFNGESVTLSFTPSTTIQTLKAKVFKKKGWSSLQGIDPKDYNIRGKIAPVWLEAHQQLTDLKELNNMFGASHRFLMASLEHKNDVGDANKRKSKKNQKVNITHRKSIIKFCICRLLCYRYQFECLLKLCTFRRLWAPTE